MLDESRFLKEPKPVGRTAIYESDADRNRSTKRRIAWRKEQASFFLSKDNFDAEIGPGFIHSWWRKADCKAWEAQLYQSTDEFFDVMEAYTRDERQEKQSGELFSTTEFREQWRGHNYDNIASTKGIVLDLDKSDMNPEDIAAALPACEMLIVSTWSHTPERHCFRVLIPTTRSMTADGDAVIKRMILGKLTNAGFVDAGVPGRRHGFDMSKVPATSLYYYPSHRPDGVLVQYRDGRQPIDPMEWIEECPQEIIDFVIDGCPDRNLPVIEEPPLEGYSFEQQANFEMAKIIWRNAGKGEGNTQFHKLGWRLFGYRMAMADIEETLRSEARLSRSPKNRLSQVPYILSDIRRRGNGPG